MGEGLLLSMLVSVLSLVGTLVFAVKNAETVAQVALRCFQRKGYPPF